jgi:hypothetical protein
MHRQERFAGTLPAVGAGGASHRLSALKPGFVAFLAAVATVTAPPPAPGSAMNLAWDPSPDTNVVGYMLYRGLASGSYSTSNTLPGPVTNTTVTGLVAGTVYYFAVTAYSSDGLQSPFSNELIVTNVAASAPVDTNATTNTTADAGTGTNTTVGSGTDTNAPPPPSEPPPPLPSSDTNNTGGGSTTPESPPAASTSTPPSNVQATIGGIPPVLFLTHEEGEAQPRLSFWGTVGADVVVQASTNLTGPIAWLSITNLTLTNAAPVEGQAAAQDALAAAFVPAMESLIPPADTSNPAMFYRLIMPYNYAVLADKVLKGKGYQTYLVVVRLPGETLHDVCYANQDQAYIDCSEATFVLALNHCGPTIREIADDYGGYVSMNWTSASTFTFTNGIRHLMGTVVKTDDPASDPPLTSTESSAININF